MWYAEKNWRLTTHKVSDELEISPPQSRDAMRNSKNEEFNQPEGYETKVLYKAW